ncbi:hypothetical protein J7T55_000325 [Diaporthe amygdali]|uniref:uncharacterized protein n=1 Tax=Phomopsis amygdali TaxID=1214568 RepID=UPI0022FF1DEA|nr:uncharacterized protein J7T55_000325 [Diaporthe amygdali]KAJ0109400.1 hypothetical protein J7T55_000325 [Diaporthe amygdali]
MSIIIFAAFGVLCLATLAIVKAITRAHASSLSQIPNAGWGAAYSRLLWAFSKEYRGVITIELPKIHEKLGPNEVSFYSIDIYDTIHKVNSGFAKDPRNYGDDLEEHSKRRRILGQLFSRSNIAKLEGLMLHHVNVFVEAISRKCVFVLIFKLTAEFSFGEAVNAVVAWSKGGELAIVANNDKKATFMPLWTLKAWARNKDPDKKSPFPNLIKVMIAAGVPTQTALSEAKENLGPGTDTTSASLAHVLYALSKNPVYQQKLYKDLFDRGFPTDMSSLENIPRLRACVKEGIRWAGAAAAMLPRVVPHGGVELCGKLIPEGTVLTSSPIWYLRDKYAYPNPELFNPYRWINDSGTTSSDNAIRDKFYVPFSKGANVCIGNHFSYYEIYLGLAKTLERFKLVHVEEATISTQLAGVSSPDWQPVQLPMRKEWVAAVLTDPLLVELIPRDAKEDDLSW